MQPRM